MHDWKTLLATPRFRSLWLALVSNNFGSWCVMAALPILVAERFGAGSELVLSLGVRILPKILLAPIAGGFLRRYGAIRVAGCALVAEGVLTAALPWCLDFALLQVCIGAIGTLDVFVNPSLLSLRGPSTPPGLSMAANTLCSVADRSAKIVGPIIGGIATKSTSTPWSTRPSVIRVCIWKTTSRVQTTGRRLRSLVGSPSSSSSSIEES